MLNPYHEAPAFLDCAKTPELQIVVSNATEAGIAFRDTDTLGSMERTFPAELTTFLWERNQYFGQVPGKDFLISSCEFIDNNGTVLKDFYGIWDRVAYEVRDDLDTLQFFAAHSHKSASKYVQAYMTAPQFHGTDFGTLPGFKHQVVTYPDTINSCGMRKAEEILAII